MRVVPRRWHNETWICSIRGHVIPAERAARLRPEDAALGEDLTDGTRIVRCLRCDVWLRVAPPPADEALYDTVPPLDQLELPRRGRPLEEAIFLRLIAINKGIHAVLFIVAAVTLIVVRLRLPAIQRWAQSLYDDVTGAIDNSTRSGHTVLARRLESLLHLDRGELNVVLAIVVAYAVIESTEAIGLWRERRWAEYLTVIATAGFVPLEVYELAHKVSAFKIGGLIVNLAIVAYLVYAKRLFGLRGGHAAMQEGIDWDAILASPLSPDRTPTSS